MSLWQKLRRSLSDESETQTAKTEKKPLAALFHRQNLEPHDFDQLEEQLIAADISARLAIDWVARLRQKKYDSPDALLTAAKKILLSSITPHAKKFTVSDVRPFIIMVSGVNGTGKTTSIGKLCHYLQNLGHSVGVVAGDNFRSAAVEQLEIWAQRTGAEIFMPAPNQTDPAALAYQAIEKTLADKSPDILIIDTAGRLHSNDSLMAALAKIPRVMQKLIADTPHESLLVIDGTTGQNSLIQAKVFAETIPLTGFIMTKLDGTAKGGMLPSLMTETELPVYFLGLGERAEDLLEFDPQQFIEALLGSDDS